MRRSTPEQLLRLVKAKERRRRLNSKRPAHMQQTETQIEGIVRRALKDGRINNHGVILKKE